MMIISNKHYQAPKCRQNECVISRNRKENIHIRSGDVIGHNKNDDYIFGELKGEKIAAQGTYNNEHNQQLTAIAVNQFSKLNCLYCNLNRSYMIGDQVTRKPNPRLVLDKSRNQ